VINESCNDVKTEQNSDEQHEAAAAETAQNVDDVNDAGDLQVLYCHSAVSVICHALSAFE